MPVYFKGFIGAAARESRADAAPAFGRAGEAAALAPPALEGRLRSALDGRSEARRAEAGRLRSSWSDDTERAGTTTRGRGVAARRAAS